MKIGNHLGKIMAILMVLMIACILGATGLSGCRSETPEPTAKEIKEVGTFVKSINVPTSFNENVKSNVETTKGSFTVIGSVSGIKGDEVVIKKIRSSWHLSVGSSDVKFRVLGM